MAVVEVNLSTRNWTSADHPFLLEAHSQTELQDVQSSSDDVIKNALRTLGLTPVSAVCLVCCIIGFVSTCAACFVKIMSRRATRLGKIFKFTAGQARLLMPATLLLFMNSYLLMLIPVFGGQFVQIVSTGHGTVNDIDRLFWQMLLVTGVSAILQVIRAGMFMLAGERIVTQLRDEAYDAIMRQEVAYMDEQSSGTLIGKLIGDTYVMQEAATSSMSTLVRTVVNVILCLVILLLISWRLTLAMLSTVPAMTVIAWCVGRANDKAGEKYQKAIGDVCELAREVFANHRTVRAFLHGETWVQTRWHEKYANVYKKGLYKAVFYAAWIGASFFIFWLSFDIVLRFGAAMVLKGAMSHGELIAYLLYTMNMSASVMILGGQLPVYTNAMGSTRKLFEILCREPAIAEGTLEPSTCSGEVEFCSVFFQYATRKEMVLQDVSFLAEPNATTAIVGQSGSGKSTCISLIQRLFDVTTGAVKVDGMDLRRLTYGYIRSTISIVAQEPILFAVSCEENICFGVSSEIPADEVQERMIHAATLANCHSFISDFPEKYQTMVGERGVQLSGGQKQRVAIARALIVRPTILLLDEATSALDAESEGLVQSALSDLLELRQHTSIVVAHRLSTVKTAEKIVVIEKGKVREQGEHSGLVAQEGAYHALVQRQLAES